jgi:hypothetical protein
MKMTIKDLQKLIESEQQTTTEQDQELNKLKSKLATTNTGNGYKKFYIWPEKNHEIRYKNSKGNCCFWHIIGAPQKDGHDMPALPYQQLLWNTLNNHKRIWIKKSRGIGATEYLLRWAGYNCLTGGFPPGSRVCIVTGPRIDLAEDLIARFKGLFAKVAPNLFDKTRSTIAILNQITLAAFPSHNVASLRGLDQVRAIISDESDYYPAFQQQEVRAVMEGYILKPNSDPHILIVSTPKAPNGLMQQIELEQDSLYYKVFLDYRYGLEGPMPIYSQAMLNEARKSPEWGREYEGKYLGKLGGVFSYQSIENATKIEYNPDNIVPEAKKSMALDPAWGSPSNFAIVVTQFVDGKIQVIFADEYPRPFFQTMINKVWELRQQLGHVTNIYCDAANPEIIQELKRSVNEIYDNQYVKEKIAFCKKNRLLVENYMTVVPINFVDGPNLLAHTKALLESPDNLIAIHPRYDKLLIALRTACTTESTMKLDKSETSYDDILDSFRMALSFYRMGD